MLVEPLRLMLARKLKKDTKFNSWMNTIDENSNNLISAEEFQALVHACTSSSKGKMLVLDFCRNTHAVEQDAGQLTSDLAIMAFKCIVAERGTSTPNSNEVLYSTLHNWLFPKPPKPPKPLKPKPSTSVVKVTPMALKTWSLETPA